MRRLRFSKSSKQVQSNLMRYLRESWNDTWGSSCTSVPIAMRNKMANSRNAILITYPVEQAINEAISLADAAGYSIIKTVTQRQITKSRFGIGRGKAEEVRDMVKEIKPDVIIFDETIKPTQIYNLASLCKVEIIDRERLILEIFERRASTTESNIQIKLAQLRYDMARAREKRSEERRVGKECRSRWSPYH